jgi:hypothetical protein
METCQSHFNKGSGKRIMKGMNQTRVHVTTKPHIQPLYTNKNVFKKITTHFDLYVLGRK